MREDALEKVTVIFPHNLVYNRHTNIAFLLKISTSLYQQIQCIEIVQKSSEVAGCPTLVVRKIYHSLGVFNMIENIVNDVDIIY